MDERVFDVSRPNRSVPDATSRPIIMGHHPMMEDPMVRGGEDNPASKPASSIPVTDSSEPARPMFPDVPSISNDTPASLPPVDSDISISDSIVDNMRNPDGPPPTGDQQFIHPGAASSHSPEEPIHSLTPAPVSHHHHRSRGGRNKTMIIVLAILVLLIAGYLAVDAGVFGKNINLPFHIFKQDSQPQTTAVSKTPAVTKPTTTEPTLPDGFTNYKLADTGLNIPYPTTWGTPTSTPEMGFSKRGGTNKADATYAYVINFATNKDVQIAITSSQYLPPTRTALYYDFLQWCTGSADGKYYKQILRFTTAAGVDTPTTATCDQGPLSDAVKVDDTTIVQAGVKAADGTVLGDIYTRNLKIPSLPVMRVKDTTAKNADDIKKILSNLTLDTSAESQQ